MRIHCVSSYNSGGITKGRAGKTIADDVLTSEEYEEEEVDSGTSGILTLNGEAWKTRDNTTYNSLLDINGVTDLFSQESTDQYNDRKQESYAEQQERRRLFHMFCHGGDYFCIAVSLFVDKDKCGQKETERSTCS